MGSKAAVNQLGAFRLVCSIKSRKPNHVKLRQPKCKSKFRNQNQLNSIVFHQALACAESDLTLPIKKAATPAKREVIAVANSQSTFLYLYPRAPFPSSQPKQLLLF